MGNIDYNDKEQTKTIGAAIGFIIFLCWGACYWSFHFFVNAFFKINSSGQTWANPYFRDKLLDEKLFWCLGVAFVIVVFGIAVSNSKEEKKIDSEKEKINSKYKEEVSKHLSPEKRKGFSGLTLGFSTGYLFNRDHLCGLANGSKVFLTPADVCKNIWIAGGIGGGKTTRFINPLLNQVLTQDCSALIFDIKGDFRREVEYLSSRVNRKFSIVGDGGLTLNLFRGCTPEVAASYLKSCFIASGSANGDGAFWADTATNYCRNLLMLIKLAKLDYSIAGLSDLVFSEDKRIAALRAAREREQTGQMDPREARIWMAVLSYMMDTVDKWEDKFRGNVQGTCESVLNPFVSPDMVDAFSVESENGEADLYDLLNTENIFLVNLPRHKFGANGARFAYLLIKLRFFSMMSERRSKPELNQSRYICFMCDEYQSIVDSVSDTDFWDKSRSSKCFGILSMQGFSSLVQAVGNPQAANAIIQNWRQRAIFRTEDFETIELSQKLLGQVDVHVTSESVSESEGRSASGFNQSVSISSSIGQSTSIQRQHLFDANDFRKLDAKFALFIGNIGDEAIDDVIEVQPLFIPENF